jgi:hypothetical protein
MIDIKKVREDLETIASSYLHDECKQFPDDDMKICLYYQDEIKLLREGVIELKRLQKKETYQNQFKNSKYVVIQDSVAKGFEFTDIKEAVDKLYSLKGNHEYDMGILACVIVDKVFMIAERKLDWSDEK